jgi:Glycosyltransferase 61
MKVDFQPFDVWNDFAVRSLRHPLRPEALRFINSYVSIIPALSVHSNISILCPDWIPICTNGVGTFERMIHTPDLYLGKAKCVTYDDGQFYTNELGMLELSDPAILIGGCSNYYHWLVDYLPRFLIADSFEEFSDWKLIINSDLKSFQLEAIQMLGIPTSQLLLVEDHWTVFGSTILLPSLLTNTTVCHSAVPKMLRDTFQPTVSALGQRKRIYLCRQDATSRRLVNHDDVLQILKDFSFETHMPGQLGFQEQVDICASADAIFGVHGAALANLVFCRPGALVFEISHPARRVTSMLILSKLAQLKHQFINAGVSGNVIPKGNPLLDDWRVDIDAMRSVLLRAFPK